ncbi:MAG TPA: hypothetical protein VJ575_06645 [Pseudogulbenkiania sp.]|nr:hypothetical protein [Pseudogulbenkiania sp.]
MGSLAREQQGGLGRACGVILARSPGGLQHHAQHAGHMRCSGWRAWQQHGSGVQSE